MPVLTRFVHESAQRLTPFQACDGEGVLSAIGVFEL